RGPGEVLGTRQTGLMQLKIADLQRDSDLLEEVKRCARALSESSPTHCEALVERWLSDKTDYAAV
ncbi:MAG TPA: ATP-dependent DNA helicase RecG, partial [Spongiibacteraceae bacterium]|nr:ATP-dependent DNA helicase RecG [Spongiibacteraceae bacterium]